MASRDPSLFIVAIPRRAGKDHPPHSAAMCTPAVVYVWNVLCRVVRIATFVAGRQRLPFKLKITVLNLSIFLATDFEELLALGGFSHFLIVKRK